MRETARASTAASPSSPVHFVCSRGPPWAGPGSVSALAGQFTCRAILCAYSNDTAIRQVSNTKFAWFAGKFSQLEERWGGKTDKARNTRQAQRKPQRRNGWTSAGAPDRQAALQSLTDSQRGARTEGAAGGRKDAQSRGAGDHCTSAGREASTRRTRERGSPEHNR